VDLSSSKLSFPTILLYPHFSLSRVCVFGRFSPLLLPQPCHGIPPLEPLMSERIWPASLGVVDALV
jgi:hypothetical protein